MSFVTAGGGITTILSAMQTHQNRVMILEVDLPIKQKLGNLL